MYKVHVNNEMKKRKYLVQWNQQKDRTTWAKNW